MEAKINIVIPSVQFSDELIYCLKKLNNQNYKNFFVTVVLDYKNKRKLPKFNFKLNILVSGGKNMSFKRNLGVRKYKSNIVAFLDSDAYPNKNWLKFANIYLKNKNKKKTIIGGPSIPFPNQSHEELLCHYAKRSFYLTGYLNFRKYKSKSRYCDWLESCNMFIDRDLYLKHLGMNNNIYLGEDKEFFERVKKRDVKIKAFYTPSLFIYHKERKAKKFFLQRMVFGSDLFNIIKFGNTVRSYQPFLPGLVMFTFLFIFFAELEFIIKSTSLIIYTLLIQLLIFIDVKKYLKKPADIFYTIILINLGNVAYVIGNIIAIIGASKLLNRKIYLKSRQNK